MMCCAPEPHKNPRPSASSPARSDMADSALHHSRWVIAALFGAPTDRAFDVRYWDGTVESGGRQAGAARAADAGFVLVLRRPGALRRMLLPPSELSIVEAFLSGDVDVDGELENAMHLGDAINARLKSIRVVASTLRHLIALPTGDRPSDIRARRGQRAVASKGSRHDAARDRAAIQYHYNVGNDFYKLWLDARMVYSCAYYRSPADSLDDAQVAKLDLVCRKLRLRPGERFLDVGCGWGALVMRAAKCYGATALGITLSEAQATLARERIAAAGLGDRCRVEILDYRDLPPNETFEKIASIGMVEHVGEDKLPTYFASLARSLAPGGLLLNHGIVSVEAAKPSGWRDRIERWLWRRDAFIDQYVFPDGQIVSLHSTIAAAEGAGFETRDVESLREHYVMTLRAWIARLARNAERAVALTDEWTYRTWRFYMTAAAYGFRIGRLNVVQTLLSKPDAAGRSMLPLTREDLTRFEVKDFRFEV
jgi:cyclopropane-fatty-acyl-phospholipid synthase